jgi:hypothetical protein
MLEVGTDGYRCISINGGTSSKVGTALSADWMRPSRWDQRNRVSRGKSIGAGMDAAFLETKGGLTGKLNRFFAQLRFGDIGLKT